jgi:hypothetical protein
LDTREDTKLRRNHRLISRFGAFAIAVLAAFIVTLSGQAYAQGIDWSQLLGGGGGGAGGGQKHQHSGQSSGSGVTVDRGTPPYTGKFVGKKEDQGIENTMTAEFACFPAADTDIPQSKAFVCYTAPAKENGSAGGPPYGPPGGAPSYGPPPDGGPPNGPPPGVE